MKKVAFFLFTIFCISSYGQYKDVNYDVSEITGSDTTYFNRIRGKQSVLIQFDYTNFDTTSAQIIVYYLNIDEDTGDTIPLIADNLNISTSQFPVALNKAAPNIINGDTTYAVGVYAKDWNCDLLGTKLIKNGLDTGNFIIRVRK